MASKVVLILTVAALTVMGCGAEQEQAPEEGAADPEETAAQEQTQVVEETTAREGETAERTAPEVVSVGGFSVERPDSGEVTVPQVTAERQEVQGYREEIQPVIENTVRAVSDLARSDVRLENGSLSLDVEVVSLEEARASVRDGLERLRNMDPPEDLEPIHQRLIASYEQALPAYDQIIEAAESGDPQRINAAVSDNLPRIESFNEETRAILQDLEQAAGEEN